MDGTTVRGMEYTFTRMNEMDAQASAIVLIGNAPSVHMQICMTVTGWVLCGVRIVSDMFPGGALRAIKNENE